ncbi:MAG: methyltransferase domain-containing protein [Chloroflexi bacterium]|nr:methyltransferase domain-containing protein [Chloroflexota bacterium]
MRHSPDPDLIQHLFDTAAERYEQDIVPVFAPLVADLVAFAAPRKSDVALDLGTGTGVLARALAPYVRHVTGIDVSTGILHAARAVPTADNAWYIQADNHRLPLAANAVTLAMASFGLNATDPAIMLPAIRRVLAPGGRLVIQEWGAAQPVDKAVGQPIRDLRVDEPGAAIEVLRERLEVGAGWDQLQDTDDYCDWLTDFGFVVEYAVESQPVRVRLASPEVYLQYKLAWTYRRVEVDAMPPDVQATCYARVRAALGKLSEPDGSLVWAPALIRAVARKPEMR